jgi:hypothetical protein
MKAVLTILLVFSCVVPLPGKAVWMNDLEAGGKRAAEEQKDLLLNFTGSEWCPGHALLQERVFSKEVFVQGVEKHFILVELDHPEDQAGLAPELREAKERLLTQYAVLEFPTLLLADESGRPYAQTTLSSFEPKEVEDYLEHLVQLKERRKVRDAALEAAEQLQGLDKAMALQSAIAEFPDETVDAFYADVVREIEAADPEDRTGFREARAYRRAVATYEQTAGELFGEGKFAEAIKAADSFIEEHDPTGLDRQHILMAKLMATVEIGTEDEALGLLAEIKAIAPESEIGLETDRLKGRIEVFFDEPKPATPE